MKTNKKTRQLLLSYSFRQSILLVLAVIFLAACRKNSMEPQTAAALNVANASPGPLSISFFLNNNLVNGPALAFTQESGYFLTSSGSKKFDATAAGTTQPIITNTINFETDKYYTLYIAGENTSLSTFLTEDDLSPPPSGKAKIRFIQLSPNGGTLALGIKGGAVLFPGQAFKTASEFIAIDPAAYTLELENTDGSTIREASLNVVAGRIYTVWAKGLKDGTEINALGLQLRANN